MLPVWCTYQAAQSIAGRSTPSSIGVVERCSRACPRLCTIRSDVCVCTGALQVKRVVQCTSKAYQQQQSLSCQTNTKESAQCSSLGFVNQQKGGCMAAELKHQPQCLVSHVMHVNTPHSCLGWRVCLRLYNVLLTGNVQASWRCKPSNSIPLCAHESGLHTSKGCQAYCMRKKLTEQQVSRVGGLANALASLVMEPAGHSKLSGSLVVTSWSRHVGCKQVTEHNTDSQSQARKSNTVAEMRTSQRVNKRVKLCRLDLVLDTERVVTGGSSRHLRWYEPPQSNIEGHTQQERHQRTLKAQCVT
jgi:hypothetical protein